METVINTGSLDRKTIANMINELKNTWGEDKITIATIHLVLKEGMEIVEKIQCPGSEKKQHVITIVKALVVDLVENSDDERIILDFINKGVLENTMELIIKASKGELNINNKETQKKIKSCTKTCIPLIIDSIIRIISLVKRSNNSKNTSSHDTKDVSIVKSTNDRSEKSINSVTEIVVEVPK